LSVTREKQHLCSHCKRFLAERHVGECLAGYVMAMTIVQAAAGVRLHKDAFSPQM